MAADVSGSGDGAPSPALSVTVSFVFSRLNGRLRRFYPSSRPHACVCPSARLRDRPFTCLRWQMAGEQRLHRTSDAVNRLHYAGRRRERGGCFSLSAVLSLSLSIHPSVSTSSECQTDEWLLLPVNSRPALSSSVSTRSFISLHVRMSEPLSLFSLSSPHLSFFLFLPLSSLLLSLLSFTSLEPFGFFSAH